MELSRDPIQTIDAEIEMCRIVVQCTSAPVMCADWVDLGIDPQADKAEPGRCATWLIPWLGMPTGEHIGNWRRILAGAEEAVLAGTLNGCDNALVEGDPVVGTIGECPAPLTPFLCWAEANGL